MIKNINLPKTTHCNNGCGHSTYTANLFNYLEDIRLNNPELVATPQLAKEFLEGVQQSVKNQFAEGKLLNEIVFD